MSLNIRHAVAAAIAVGACWAQTAAALAPADFTPAQIASNVLRFSGATATDATVFNIVLTATGVPLCSTVNVDVYRSRAGDGVQYAVLCTGNAAAGLPAQPIAFIKESEFGSAAGSAFVTSSTPTQIEFLNPFSAAPAFVCGGNDDNPASNDGGTFNPGAAIDVPVAIAAGNQFAHNEYRNCTPQQNSAAEAGISDVESRLLGGTGNSATATSQFQILFGVPVSLNLYRALQIAQGITAQAACDTAAEQDTEACVPSLNKSTIASIYGGFVTDWSQLETSAGAQLTTVNIAGPAGAPTDTAVYVCRRGNTSGTQIGTRAYFLSQGCGGTDQFIASTNGTPNGEANGDPWSDTTFANTQIFAGDGSGPVRDCLDLRDDQNRWAIGVLSTENAVDGTFTVAGGAPAECLVNNRRGNIGGDGGTAAEVCESGTPNNEGFEREFRFVRINGALPSIEAAANGSYDFFTENVCYARNSALAGVELQLYNAICGTSGVSAPARIIAANDGFDNQPWGDSGNMLIPFVGANTPNDFPVTQAEMDTNPTNSLTKSISGTINNCSVAMFALDGAAGPTPGPN